MLKLPGDEFVTIELVHDPAQGEANFGTGLVISLSRSSRWIQPSVSLRRGASVPRRPYHRMVQTTFERHGCLIPLRPDRGGPWPRVTPTASLPAIGRSKGAASAGCRGSLRRCCGEHRSRAQTWQSRAWVNESPALAAGRLRSDAVGTSPPAISLAEHRVEFGVGPDLPDLLRAAAGDGDLGSPLQRLLA